MVINIVEVMVRVVLVVVCGGGLVLIVVHLDNIAIIT